MALTRKTPIRRSTKPIKRSRIKKRARKPSETLRIYGPPARREFVKSLPCAACGVVDYSENAHVAPASEKGTGYKAGFEWIVPLCARMPMIGCHALYDQRRSLFNAYFPGFDPSTEASRVQKLWQEYQEERK